MTTHISADVQRITLNASCMTISGERTEQLHIFCRVTGFTSDFLSFIDVELIRFFHGALHLIDSLGNAHERRFSQQLCKMLQSRRSSSRAVSVFAQRQLGCKCEHYLSCLTLEYATCCCTKSCGCKTSPKLNITAANWLTWQCQAARIPGRDVIAASDLQRSGALAPAAGHHRLCV